MTTDWKELARQVGSWEEGKAEIGGSDFARNALEEILGEEWVETAVEQAISFKPGAELAMNCLRHLRSKKAVKYAYHVYKTSDGERAAQAVWLIKHIANPISFQWVEEFLNDRNVADWGIGVLDQLLWTNAIPNDERANRLLDLADELYPGPMKERTDFIREYLSRR